MAFFKRSAAPTSSPSSASSSAPTAHDAAGSGSGNGTPPEYTIDELARAAGTTVRNVRSYQDRGLIDPPERRGRVGIYTQTHLGRLRLINHLLARGYTLNNIQELLKAIVEGHDLRSILGLESAIGSPWTDEAPRHYSYLALARLFGRAISRPALAKAIALGLLEPDGMGYLARSPRMLTAGVEIARAGFALEDVLSIVEHARGHFEAVSDRIVAMVVRELDRFGEGKLPPPQDVPRLVDILWRIRPLAMVAVEAEMMRAMEQSANKYLGDRVAAIIEHLHDAPEDGGAGNAPKAGPRKARR
ncbi:MerR family transcriptional regulator [Cupriavidus basilensis]|uniref:Putative transcriptional regulator n=1 Tax=Cupriavidus basilensis TaxID=68895 RepID=A0A0C4YLV4_9BURK|nr:MerR family transcriptional regulator [Cupriavidus basilensis]AJG21576.1 putative transcriptional regulator [Cupriavidus basilensis]